MRLDSSGNLFVGGTNGNARLTVRGSGTTSATASIEGATSSGATRFLVSDDGLCRWYGTSNAETMRLDNAGNLGIAQGNAPTQVLSLYRGGSTNAIMSAGNSNTGLDGTWFGVDTAGNGIVNVRGAFPLLFSTSALERARISSTGLFLVNIDNSTGYGDGHRIYRNVSEGSFILSVDGGVEYAALFQDVASGGYSTAAAGIWVGKNSSNSRSINAGGTVNASGADYAEYMTKAGEFALAKGDVCGIDADGKLTNVFANAISFVVKSTDPSYVGGDSWGANFKDDPEGLEAARQKVDRIAFAGQVPVNVLGATPGQYIVPINDNGAIKGVAVSNPSFEQYQAAVGKVIAVEDDGRARIIVKIA
jgi:hypothetical protein